MDEKKLYKLIKKMTMEEKVGQLTQVVGTLLEEEDSMITGPMAEQGVPDHLIQTVGSVLGISGAKKIKGIQQKYLEKSRLKIPLLFMADVIHGQKTIFPIPLGLAASWNPELIEKCAEIAAKEASISGLHVTFSPMVDLVKDARWGRVMESTGEDSYLNDIYAEAFVKGYQGENLTEDKFRLAACVKHFIGYGAPEGGREYNTVNMSERQLRQDYLSSFQTAINAGVEMVMTSFNTVDGIPSTGNKHVMQNLLRGEMNFDKVLISDWGAVLELVPHGVASGEKEAAQKSIQASVDIEMMTFTYAKHLESLIAEGKITEEYVDESVLRILKLKNKLGLFEDPFRGADEISERTFVFSKEHRAIAQEVAEESIVLLKNEKNILPLKGTEKIALIGPFKDEENILGEWSWKGNPKEAVQLLPSLIKAVGAEKISFSKGSMIERSNSKLLEEALKVGEEADIIIMALGEASSMSGEAASRTNIQLPDSQKELLEQIALLGKPIVTVLFNGRPLDLNEVEECSDALLEAWFPGTEGGSAITNILFGVTTPSGRLTMSFPENVGQIPIYYNHYNTGRPLNANTGDGYVSSYLDSSNEPRYPFGYGLSYTTFKYKEVTLSSNTLTSNQSIKVETVVSNIGNRRGKEVVQFYVRDLVGEVVRPVKELKGFEKIELDPKESKKVSFTLTEKMLRYVHADLSIKSDEGEFELFVGGDSTTTNSAIARLVKE